MPKAKVNSVTSTIFYLSLIFILILLSLININSLFKTNKVLGAETQKQTTTDFWDDFLSKNPNYLPGLIENGNVEAVRQIDPNFKGLE